MVAEGIYSMVPVHLEMSKYGIGIVVQEVTLLSSFEKFLIQAGNADVFDGNERVEDALKYLGLKTLHEPLPGMEVNLMAHQVMGVKWMVEKEKNDFKGGCLADEMGLGKV